MTIRLAVDIAMLASSWSRDARRAAYGEQLGVSKQGEQTPCRAAGYRASRAMHGLRPVTATVATINALTRS
jgi:hypothetical protein